MIQPMLWGVGTSAYGLFPGRRVESLAWDAVAEAVGDAGITPGQIDAVVVGVPGVVEADALLGPERVQPGDTVLALASSGLHSNGYSLVREIVRHAGLELEQDVPGLSRPLGAELLEPSRIYALDCLALAADCEVHAYAHITGGGLAANLARVLPGHVDAVLDRATWEPPAIFGVLAAAGNVPPEEMERVFNMGVGMTAVVARDATGPALELLAARGVPAWVLGEVTPGTGEARLIGKH